MSDDSSDLWPFFREHPDKVVLEPVPGVTPADAPPVRIFLGTEESQYRAERIFFYSILQVRDPARTYEIYLMKNLVGFDRSSWRTGFTNYRYAIPTLAGGTGKAIYNDVDQIYLADPALLFDLPMDGRGYLAIADTDTSVMLIDCAKMLPMWNREAASTGSKSALLNTPRKTPGLWGQLDPHWNARDQEYDEKLTKCLHYTALHQQPWEPFPEVYSYHANPLAYIWHDLEARADREGYQVFTAQAPSPDFYRRLGRNERPVSVPPKANVPDAKAVRLARQLQVSSTETVGAFQDNAGVLTTAFGGELLGHIGLDRGVASWPAARADLVAASGLFEHVPPADIPWIMDQLFARAGKLLYVTVGVKDGRGLGSAIWWRRRLAEAAQQHPGKSWHLDAVGQDAGVHAYGVERLLRPSLQRVWVLTTGDDTADRQAIALAQALGAPFETKRLHLGLLSALPNGIRNRSRLGVDLNQSASLAAPWPDLVIGGPQAAPVARWIRRRADGRCRLVQIGAPGSGFGSFDLVIATPDEQLPIRDNVLQIAAPLTSKPPTGAAADTSSDLLRPIVAIFVTGGRHPYVMSTPVAVDLAKSAAAELDGEGSLLFCITSKTGGAMAEAMAKAVTLPSKVVVCGGGHGHDEPAGDQSLDDILARADGFVVTGDDRDLMARAAATGKPVALAELPLWYDRFKIVRPTLEVLKKLTGGGVTYRGTPHQQHVVGRLLDRMTVAGLRRPRRDNRSAQRALIARGLAKPLGRQPVSTTKPLDDLGRAVARVERLLAERPTSG